MTITELVQEYGVNSVLIAAGVCILTGLIKMPIKRLAAKTKEPSKYTRYITFLPLMFGLGATALYEYLIAGTVRFTGDFVTLWLTSSSLSLAIYALLEKFIPSKRKILSDEEIRQNQTAIDRLKECLLSDERGESGAAEPCAEREGSAEPTEQRAEPARREKIVLTGKKHD